MRHKSRILSAFALGAVTSLLMCATVYRAGAEDIDVNAPDAGVQTGGDINGGSGTGDGTTDLDGSAGMGDGNTDGAGALSNYVDGEASEVSRLDVRSLGVFSYEAGGMGRDILISSSDIKDLESATKALSKQLLSLGSATKIADDTAKAEAGVKFAEVNRTIADNKAVNEAAINTFKTDVDGRFFTVSTTIAANKNEADGKFDEVNATITANKSEADTRFGEVNTAIENNKNESDTKFGEMSATIATNKDEADTKFGEVNTAITANKNEIDNNRTSANQRMDSLETATNNRFEDVEKAISDNATSGTSAVTNLQNDMNTRFSNVDKTIGELDIVRYEYENIPGNPTITFSPKQASTTDP